MSLLNFSSKNRPQSTDASILPLAEFLVAVVDKPVQLVDVRTKREYDLEHMNGAIHIDWLQPLQFKRAFKKLDLNLPVCLYCGTGDCSPKAARKIAQLGFPVVYLLEGGISSVKQLANGKI